MNVALYNLWDNDSPHRDFVLVGTPSSLTVNVSSKVYGAEFDIKVKPISRLTAGATFTYTHAAFDTQPVYVFGVPQVFNQVPDTPKTVASLYGEYTIRVTVDYEVALHGDVYDQAKTYAESRSINNYGTILPSYTLANFRVGLENTREHWSLQANIKNAFNRVYYAGALPTGVIYQIPKHTSP